MTAPHHSSALFAELYRELKTLAAKHVRNFDGASTLSTTALLHEAYLQFADRSALHFPDRAHFLAYASRAMRGILIDYARSRRTEKRGGEFVFTSGTGADQAPGTGDNLDLEQLGESLDELATLEPRLAEVVDLHFFCGFTFAEIAEQRGTSERTVLRDWRKARLLLANAFGAPTSQPDGPA
ncbi:MAG: sigma-70 family RNA polymerase sigma factor [Cytophagaceae bacterium]|nr:sigma-70 family RNA polymerase sigma factor [Gemmatimonadaceae bacterium]